MRIYSTKLLFRRACRLKDGASKPGTLPPTPESGVRIRPAGPAETSVRCEGMVTEMESTASYHEKIDLRQYDMPIKIREYTLPKDGQIGLHWHDQIELLYFTQGQAAVRCGSRFYQAGKNDLIVVNRNELHQIRCLSEKTVYQCVIFDAALLQSRVADACEARYINPIFESRILFQNQIAGDPAVGRYLMRITDESETRAEGYELAVKAAVFELIVYLLRFHVRLVLSPRAHEMRMRNLRRFNPVLEYIDAHLSEDIPTERLCTMVHLSRYYFCHQFRQVTGTSLGEYRNRLRIARAQKMLAEGRANVTETAFACGFESLNYFCRLFKQYTRRTPSSLLKEGME